MRVGLISPYSYTYPGGVGYHVEALAEELMRQGHQARLLAPFDPDDRRARIAHRGARPQRRTPPDYLVSLGRTVGLRANGSVSNLALSAAAHSTLSRELRTGRYDVVHVHEPNAPVAGWCGTEMARTPLVGTFHAYSTSPVTNNAAVLLGARRFYNKLHVRIAVSEAARWTAERFYGGRYRVIPNGVDLEAAHGRPKPAADELRLLFVGRSDERKGLPVLLRAFEALRATGVPARLTVAGAATEEVEPLLLEGGGIELAGRVSEAEKWRLLHEADVVCAPSLGGESFGMVLAESYASGTPVVCSAIAGYRELVRDGTDGVLVPPGRPTALAEALRGLALDPARRVRMGVTVRERAERLAWPNVTREVVGAYEEAIAVPTPAGVLGRTAARAGLRPADGLPPRPARRVPSIEPPPSPVPAPGGRRAGRITRRGAVAAMAITALALGALALERVEVGQVVGAALAATPIWVVACFALMAGSMLLRSEAWHAILRAALPRAVIRRAGTARATMIGVLMSATLPARLGEPSRALVMARQLGSVSERLPVVLGTIVSQTALNVLALAILGGVMFATVGLFHGGEQALVPAALAPVVVLLSLLAAPRLLGGARSSRFAPVRQATVSARRALARARGGLRVFRTRRLGPWAVAVQLAAWAVQWLACYALLAALGLAEQAGMAGAGAVLFAINLTAALPATPANVGVFQAACMVVLSAYGVGEADALAYGVILQAVEIATALGLGMPALVREGMSWRDMRRRAMHATPVELPVPVDRRAGEPVEA